MKSFFVSIAMLFASAIASATTIDTLGNSGFDFRCLGIAGGCGQTFGQTFTVSTSDAYLSSFSFNPSKVIGGSLAVQFNLYQWNGATKTGSVLYQSGIDTLTNASESTLLTYAPGVQLMQGLQYVAYLDTADIGNIAGVTSGFTVFSDSVYPDGTFVWQRSASDIAWNIYGYDSQFQAVFRAAAADAVHVPEPVTLALFSLGLVGFAATRRKSAK